MKNRRKVSRGRTTTYLLLALAAVLLLGSAVGSTRAALTYYSENYTAEIQVYQIGVSLLENGETISSRDYKNNKFVETSGELLENMLGDGEKLQLGKRYDETLTVKNSGTIDEYVRVRIYKYWTKRDSDTKETTLSPDLIKLNLNEEEWVNPHSGEKDRECTELYYKGILPVNGEATFANGISIDGKLADEVEVEETKEGGFTTTTMTYKYNGVKFHVKVEVDAVQTHNAQDAIRSAWGVDAAALGIL